MSASFDSFVTKTKIVVPSRRSHLITREHLLNRLQDLLDYRLINITAPAGYGKTSLLVDAADQLDMPICWYTIDALDNDPQRFIIHFLASLYQQFPALAQLSPASLESLADLSEMVTPVINAVYATVHEHFIIVLDDFHLINNQEVINFVDHFVRFADENCHVVIASRRLISLPSLVLFVGRSEVGGLGTPDLAFGPAEIQQLIEQNYNVTLSRDKAEELAEVTEGWVTGLLLSTQAFWRDVVDRMQLANVSGIDVYDYLAHQVLDQQPASVQDFLLRTALLEEFDANLCEQVFGPATYSDGQTWVSLTRLVLRNNLFVQPMDETGVTLRYHQLFQEFLQKRFKRDHPAEAQQILISLAEFYTREGEWEKAYYLYQRLENTPGAAELVEKAGLAMVHAGRFKTLGSWIDNFPPALLNKRPILVALRGYASAMLGDVKQGASLLGRAETEFRKNGDSAGLAQTLVWQAGVHFLLGNYEQSLACANEGLALTQLKGSASALQATALRVKGQSLLTARQTGPAIASLEQALEVYKTLADKANIARSYLELGVANMATGRYSMASRYYDLARDYFQTAGNSTRLADLLNNQGVLYHLIGNYPQAISAMESALSFAESRQYVRMQAYVLAGIGDIYADIEAFSAAENAYRQAHHTALQIDDGFLLLYLEVAHVNLACRQKDFEQAHTHLQYAGQMVQNNSSQYEKGLYFLAAGNLAFAEEQLPLAIQFLEQAEGHFKAIGQQVEQAQTCLILATVHFEAQNKSDAFECLSRALHLAEPLHSKHPLVVVGQNAEPLLKAAQRQRNNKHGVAQLLKQVQQFQLDIPTLRRNVQRQSHAVPLSSARLVVEALGPARVMLNDELISSGEWQSQKRVRELFFYLLAHPQGQTRDAIGLTFWPESSQNDLKRQFRNTIYRLRRATDKDFIVYDQDMDRYYFNREMDYQYDVEIFEAKLARARDAKNVETRITELKEAVKLYRGPYLLDFEQTWLLAERQRLSHLYVQANLTLARHYLNTKNYNATLNYAWDVLKEDPCQEIAHRLIMRAYAGMGDRASAVRQYKECERILREEVGVSVSAQTRQLYNEIIR
ncbi:MAG: hypothetical protein D6768_18795 [Chloroflexi bacterium]|nr:MAG: hypothetical protein D6768_18795 [Chloroflexota bacterium]